MNTKVCSMCHLEKKKDLFFSDSSRADGLAYRCKACHKKFKPSAITRLKSRQSQLRQYAKHPEKPKARSIACAAIRSGKLVRLPCRVCGNPKSQAHHDDYSKPLEVQFFCDLHHKIHHKCLAFLAELKAKKLEKIKKIS